MALLSSFPALENIQSAQQDDKGLKNIIDGLSKDTILPKTTHPGLKKTFFRRWCTMSQELTEWISAHLNCSPISLKEYVPEQLQDHAGHLGVLRTSHRDIHQGMSKKCSTGLVINKTSRHTSGNVKERFHWPGYKQVIETYTRECQRKVPRAWL